MKAMMLWTQALLSIALLTSFGCNQKTCDLDTSYLEDVVANARISDLRAKIRIVRENIDDCDKVVTKLKAYSERGRADLEKFKEKLNELGNKYINSGCNEEGREAFSRVMEKEVKSGVVKEKTNCDKYIREKCLKNWEDINRAMGDVVITWGTM